MTGSYRFDKNGYSALDWDDGADPRPDYYRNLPSYLLRQGDEYKAAWAEYGWQSDWNIRQIDWDRLYNANYNNTNALDKDINGITSSSRRSNYAIEERMTNQQDIALKLQLMHYIRNNNRLNGGIDLRYNRTEYYKRMKDLLGGDYWYDVDKYAERDFVAERTTQNDLKYFDQYGHARVVRKGDKYGYDYYAHVRSAKAWLTWDFNYGRFEGTLAGDVGYTKMWREGLFQKGSFENNSYGDSKKKEF